MYPVNGKKGVWIADGAYGLALNMAPISGLEIGDIIHVTGTIDAFNAARQVKDDGVMAKDESFTGLATPVVTTIDEAFLTNISQVDQGKKVSVTGKVKALEGSGNADHTVTLTVGSKDIKVYASANNCGQDVVESFDKAQVGRTITVTGFMSARNTTDKNVFDKNTLEHYQIINPAQLKDADVVIPDFTGIALNKATTSIEQGKTETLSIVAVPAGAVLPSGNAVWSIAEGGDNGKITVANGIVSVAADATVGATATVKAVLGDHEATCVVTVKAPAVTVSDTLTRDTTGVTSTSYTDWTATGTSGANYSGNSAGGNTSIQLRSDKSTSGIVSTTSGGKIRKVTIVWESHTTNGRKLDIYGSNTAYTAPTDLYDDAKKGTNLGSIVYGTSTELTIEGDYTYIGIRSNYGAMYISSITIVWAA